MEVGIVNIFNDILKVGKTPQNKIIEKSKKKFLKAANESKSKGKFLMELEEFVEKAKSNKNYDEKKVELLGKEVSKTLSFASESFSVLRAVGLDDPMRHEKAVAQSVRLLKKMADLKEECKGFYSLQKLSLEKQLENLTTKSAPDSEDSLDFLGSTNMNESLFGPEIPEEKKPAVSRIMEKMAYLWEQKQSNRARIFERWRVVRLNQKIKLVQDHNRVYLILENLFRRRLNHFFDIKQSGASEEFYVKKISKISKSKRIVKGTAHEELLFDSMSPFRLSEAKQAASFSLSNKAFYDSVINKPEKFMGNLKQDGKGGFITTDGLRLRNAGNGDIIAPDGTTMKLLDVRSSLDIREEEETENRGNLKLERGMEVEYGGQFYLSDGKGAFIEIDTGEKISIPDNVIEFYLSDNGEGVIAPKGIEVKHNSGSLYTDGKGNFSKKRGKNIKMNKVDIDDLNKQAYGNYRNSLEERLKKKKLDAEKGINEGWILEAGIPVNLNCSTLVSNGIGGFIGPSGHLARLHGYVEDWLNLKKTTSNLKKGKIIHFNNQNIKSDGRGKFKNSKGVQLRFGDDVNAFLNLGWKNLSRGASVTLCNEKLIYDGNGGFKDKAGNNIQIPESTLALLLTGETIVPGALPHFGLEIWYNGKKMIADGYGGFLNLNGNSIFLEEEILNLLNENIYFKNSIYSSEDNFEIPEKGYVVSFGGQEYISDGQGGYNFSNGSPANLSLGLASWLNGRATLTVDEQLKTGGAPNMKKGDILVYDEMEYISDGTGGFVNNKGETVELPPEFMVSSISSTQTMINMNNEGGLEQQQEMITKLQFEISSLQMKLDSALAQVDRKDEQIDDKLGLIKEREAQIKKKNKEIKELDRKLQNVMISSPQKSPGYVANFSPFSKSPNNDSSMKEISPEELTQKNIVLRRDNKNLKSQLKIMTDRNKETNERFQLQTSELKSSVKDKDIMIKDLKSQLKNLKSDFEKFKRESDKLTLNFNKLKDTSENRKHKGEEVQKELKEFREKLRLANKDIENLNKELTKERRAQNDSIKEAEHLKTQIKDMKDNQKKTKQNFSSLKSMKDQLIDKIKGKELEWKKIEGDYKRRYKELSKKHKEILEEKFKMEKDHIKQITESEYEHKKQLNDLQSKFNQFRDTKAAEVKKFFSEFEQNRRKERAVSKKRIDERKKLSQSRENLIHTKMNTLTKKIISSKGGGEDIDDQVIMEEVVIESTGGLDLENFQDEINEMVGLKLKNAKEEIMQQYEDRIESLTHENVDLQNELSMMNRENSDLQEMVQNLKEQLESGNDEQEERLRRMIRDLEAVNFPAGSLRGSINLRKSNPHFSDSLIMKSGFNPRSSYQLRASFEKSPNLRSSIGSNFDPYSGPRLSKSPPRVPGLMHSRALMPQGTSNYQYGSLLTNLRKARLMNSTLKKIMKSNKQRAFMSIFAANVKDSRALKEAGLRVKGRLLMMMKARYGGCQLRRHFLRWTVVINKNLLRDCITKIAIYSRINHQSAFWRFRTLIQKNLKVKLPEAAKRARIMTASIILESIAQRKLTEAKVAGWNNLKPLICSEKLRKLMHCIKSKIIRDNLSKVGALKKFKERNKKMNNVVKRMVNSFKEKTLDSFKKLTGNKVFKNEIEKKAQLVRLGCQSADIISNKVNNVTERAMGITPFMNSTKIRNFVKNKLLNANRNKLGHSLKILIENNRKIKEREIRRKKLKKYLLNKLSESSKSKQSESLTNLSMNSKMLKARENLHNTKKKNLFSSMFVCQKGKLGQCLDHLYRNNLKMKNIEALDYSDREKQNYMKKRLVRRLIKAQGNKLRNSLDNLKEHNAELKATELNKLRKRLRILNYLISGSRGKVYKALDRLKENAVELSNDDKLKNALQKMEEEKRKKAGSTLCEAIKRGMMGKLEESVDTLVSCNKKYNESERIRDLEKEKEDKIKTKLLRDFLKAQLAKRYQAFINAKIFAQKVKSRIDLDNHHATYIFKTNEKKKNRLLRELTKALLTKQRRSFDNLRKNKQLLEEDEEKKHKENLLRNKMKEQLIKGLFRSQNVALAQAYYKLKDNSEQLRVKNERETRLKNGLVKKLVFGFLTKERESLSILTANNKMMKLGNERKIKLRFRLLNGLVSSLNSKYREAYEKLYNNAEILKGVTLLERERRRRILSKMFGMRNNKTLQDTIACYMIMKVHAFRKRSKEEILKRMMATLQNSQRAKVESAINNLRTHNLAAWNEDRLNQTLIDIQMDKELRLKHKLFKNLMKAHASKAMSCLRKMKYLMKYQREQEEKCKEKLNFFVMNAKNKAKNDAYKAYRLMVEFAKNQKLFEFRVKMMTSKIVNWMSKSISDDKGECFRRAKEYNDISKLNEKIGNRVKRRLVAMISAANSKKLFDAFTFLKSNKTHFDNIDKEKQKYRKYIANFITKGGKLKAQSAYRIMVEFAKRKRENEHDFNRSANKLGLGLNRACKYKLLEALGKLRQHKENLSKDEYMRSRAGRLLVNKLRFNYENSLDSALRRFIDHCNRSREDDKDRKDKIRKLAGKFVNAHEKKLKNSFKNLFKHNQDMKEAEEEENVKKAMVFRKLNNSMMAKLAQALNGLERYADNAKLKEAEISQIKSNMTKENKKTRLLRNLFNHQKLKSFNAFSQLVKFKKYMNDKEKMEGQIKRKLLRMLIKSQNGSLGNSFGKLRQNADNLKSDEERKRHLLDRVFNKLFKSQTGCQRGVLNKLKHNRDHIQNLEKKKNNIMKRFIRKVGNTQNTRLEKAMEILIKHNDDNKKIEDRIGAMRRRIVRGMVKAMTSKLRGGLKNLMLNNERLREKEEKANNLKKSLISRLVSKTGLKVIDSWENLKENALRVAREGKRKDKIMNKLIMRLAKGQRGQLGSAFDLLRRNNEIQGNASMREKQIVKTMLILMQKAQIGKVNRALKKMRENKKFENYRLKTLQRMLNRIVKSVEKDGSTTFEILRKMNSAMNEHKKKGKNYVEFFFRMKKKNDRTNKINCYRAMVNFAMRTKNKAQRERMIKRRVINIFASKQLAKIDDSLRRMRNWANEDMQNERKRKVAHNVILRGIIRASNSKVSQAFRKCYDNYIKLKDADVLNRTLVEGRQFLVHKLRTKLFKNFLNAQKLKKQDAIHRLSQHRKDCIRENQIKAKLIKKLGRIQMEKLNSASQILKNCSKIRTKAIKKIIDSLVKGQNGKCRKSLENLSTFSIKDKVRENQRSQLLNRVFTRISNNAYTNVSEAFQRLYGKKLAMSQQQRSILPNLLDQIYKSRLQQASEKIKMSSLRRKFELYFSGLLKWKLSHTEAKLYIEKIRFGQFNLKNANLLNLLDEIFSKRKASAFSRVSNHFHLQPLEKILVRVTEYHKSSQKHYLEKFVQHRLNQRIKAEKLINFFRRLKEVATRKSVSTVNKMRVHNLNKNHSEKIRNMKLEKILLESVTRQRMSAFEKLFENYLNISKFSRVISVANSKTEQKSLEHYLRKWIKIRGYMKTGEAMQVVSNMFKVINDNHRKVTKNSFRNWAKGNKRAKCEMLSHLISKLITKRQQQAYDSIVYNYEMLRRDQIKRGIVALMNKVEKFKHMRYVYGFNSMRIENENKWLKKVINIWTLETHVDYQISFWRLRYKKDIGTTKVSPQQALKLKSLVSILNKKIFKNLSKAFWRIDQGKNTPDDMNVSFAVMPLRSSMGSMGRGSLRFGNSDSKR